jgi:hypothetical protein
VHVITTVQEGMFVAPLQGLCLLDGKTQASSLGYHLTGFQPFELDGMAGRIEATHTPEFEKIIADGILERCPRRVWWLALGNEN